MRKIGNYRQCLLQNYLRVLMREPQTSSSEPEYEEAEVETSAERFLKPRMWSMDVDAIPLMAVQGLTLRVFSPQTGRLHIASMA